MEIRHATLGIESSRCRARTSHGKKINNKKSKTQLCGEPGELDTLLSL